jgi:excisionase family DNA binding protein
VRRRSDDDAPLPLTPNDFGIPMKWVFKPSELARLIGVSSATIHRMIEDGTLLALPVRSQYRIPYSEVVRYFERRQDPDRSPDRRRR